MKKVLFIGLLAGVIYIATKKPTVKIVETPSLQSQKDFIMSMAANDSEESQKNLLNLLENKFLVQEINDTFNYMNALKNNIQMTEYLTAAIKAISVKYNVFT